MSTFLMSFDNRGYPTCREFGDLSQDSVTYRDGAALVDAWHEEVGVLGLNPTLLSRLAKWYLR